MSHGNGKTTKQLVAGLILLGILAAGLICRNRTLFSQGDIFFGGCAGQLDDSDESGNTKKETTPGLSDNLST